MSRNKSIIKESWNDHHFICKVCGLPLNHDRECEICDLEIEECEIPNELKNEFELLED